MRIIIPMAGMGKRLRPHTLTTPKPLIKFAGKSIVEHLVDEISSVFDEKIEEIAFIIGNFGKDVEKELIDIANRKNAKAKIYYQNEALGTAHAVYCAKESLTDKIIVAFADTLFKARFEINDNEENIIWVKKVDNPSQFGVVKLDDNEIITDFIEKPKDFVSDLAIIGIYYFHNGSILKNELKYLIENNIRGNNEFQLTDALERMKNNENVFKPGLVTNWMDCGNKKVTVETSSKLLELNNINECNGSIENSILTGNYFIGNNSKIVNSIIGENVSIGNDCNIKNCIIKNSIIQNSTKISKKVIKNSMIGSNVNIEGNYEDYSIGDFTNI